MKLRPLQALTKANAPLWVIKCATLISQGTAEQRHRDVVRLYLRNRACK